MVYRRTERVEERLQDKRDRILQAVRKVVGEVGFRGAQVTMVAEAAGVATGTVYRYFPRRASCLLRRWPLTLNMRLGLSLPSRRSKDRPCRGWPMRCAFSPSEPSVRAVLPGRCLPSPPSPKSTLLASFIAVLLLRCSKN